jgi:hypothetical protein
MGVQPWVDALDRVVISVTAWQRCCSQSSFRYPSPWLRSVRHVDGPYNKDLVVKPSGSRGVYGKFHEHFLY